MFKLKNNQLIFWLLIVSLVGSIGYLQFYMRRASAPQLFGKAIRFIDTQNKVISLTFDDGPNPESTKNILDILKEYNVKATFFILGKHAQKYPELVKAIMESGNEIGNHSWSHERLTYKSPAFIINEIENTDKLIKESGYGKEIPFRAPYGHKLVILPFILMQAHRTHYLWNIELDDWDSPPPQIMLNSLKKQIKPGSIVLLHDGYNNEYQPRLSTIEFVKLLLNYCRKYNYKVVPVTELIRYK